MITLYCVGIHFLQDIPFKADTASYVPAGGTFTQTGPVTFMSGKSILAFAAEKYGLRYKLADSALFPQPQHVEYLSYTPTVNQDPKPRVTLGPNTGRIFPFYGQTLSFIEILAPIGELSRVIQYTVQWPKTAHGPFNTPAPVTLNNTGRPDSTFPAPASSQSDAAFGSNGFPDNCEIRFRLMSIFCTS